MTVYNDRVIIVESGDYQIRESGDALMEAYLGTCVGVSLWDPVAKVGGLIHILLPEPLQMSTDSRPWRYAAAGLPLFIQLMVEKGADKSRLRAAVAGGALVGSVSTLDLELDIGGRTTDVVETVLNEEGIQIDYWETGGYFSCRLALQLADGSVTITPIGFKDLDGEIENVRFDPEEILLHAQRLRPIPQIALKILRMIGDETSSFEDVAEVVRQDQTITAKVINLCNSPLLRRNRRIDSIDRALTVLGEKSLLKLVVSAAVEKTFPENERGYSLVRGGLFQHAVGAAQLASRLARTTGLVDDGVAYTAGLLHDLGKVALDQYIAAAAPLFYRSTLVEKKNLLQVESRLFGVNHASLGGSLARSWDLPESLTAAIEHHHWPEKAESHQELVHIVYFADLLMSRFNVNLELDNINTAGFKERLARIGLRSDQLPMLIDALPGESLFNADLE